MPRLAAVLSRPDDPVGAIIFRAWKVRVDPATVRRDFHTRPGMQVVQRKKTAAARDHSITGRDVLPSMCSVSGAKNVATLAQPPTIGMVDHPDGLQDNRQSSVQARNPRLFG